MVDFLDKGRKGLASTFITRMKVGPILVDAKGLSRQLVGITLQQAEKDFKTGEFYRRTGHPGSAWFYYELVRMRYPNTKYFDLATQRMHELRAKAGRDSLEDAFVALAGFEHEVPA